ncbi:MAG: hypothetical protein JXR41_12235 [Bacteroidales bacterium]|nr:hypothetical protein [Bacteroidales bacterium]MBN2763854.1 hypothetical protein [Bacteroidales bacterium]
MTFIISAQLLQAQYTFTKTNGFYPGLGIGIGVFYPEDVNEYIEADLPSNIITSYGNTDIYMYEALNASLTYKIKWIDITAILEYALGPKWIIITNGTNHFYNFRRISPGLLVNFYVPTGTGRHALFLGGGAQYHFMKFEDITRNKIGFRVNLGYCLQFNGISVQPYLAFNLANAKGPETQGTYIGTEQFDRFDLNYTGGQIGVNLSFHKPIAHR